MKKIIIALLCALTAVVNAADNKFSASVSSEYDTKSLNYGRTIATDAIASGVQGSYKLSNPVSQDFSINAGITSFNDIHNYGSGYTLAPNIGVSGDVLSLPLHFNLDATYFSKDNGADNWFYSGKLAITDSKLVSPYLKMVWADNEGATKVDRYGGLIGIERNFSWKTLTFHTYAEGGALNQYNVITAGGEVNWNVYKFVNVFAGAGYNWNSTSSTSVDTYTGAFGNGGLRVKF
jgi:hypothetical protein